MKTNLLTIKASMLLLMFGAISSVNAQRSAAPLMISGFHSVAKGTEVAFSVAPSPGTTGYYWNYPSSWKLVKGQGTTQAIFEIHESSVSGIVSVDEYKGDGRRNGTFPVIVAGAKTIQPRVFTEFGIKAFPTTSHSVFNVQVSSNNQDTPIQIRVVDLLGRIIEMRSNIVPNANVQLGAGYKAGGYIIEAIQGESTKQMKVIKQ